MNRVELNKLEAKLEDEVFKRTRLGGYSVDAPGMLMLAETLLAVVQHLKTLDANKK